MLFIGHTRFSLFDPNSTSWVASNGSKFSTIDEYRDYLFSDERLDTRANIFINYSLPILELASDGYEYYHVVSYSDSLPERFEAKLLAASARYPFLILDKHVNGKGKINLDILARQKLSLRGRGGEIYGHFRLDDDDLLSVNFFRQSSKYMSDAFVGFVVSYGAGLTAIFNDGNFYYAHHAYSPLNSMGQLRICSVGENQVHRTPTLSSHNRVDRFNPVILDSQEISYLWVRHLGQDTSLNSGRGRFTELSNIARELQRMPVISDSALLVESFPSVDDSYVKSLPGKSVGSLSKCDLSQGMARISIENGGVSQFSVRGQLALAKGSNAKSVLTSFVINNLDSSPVSNVLDLSHGLRAQGIMLSPDKSIGFFKYVGADKAVEDFEIFLDLPDGVVCSEVRVMNWSNAKSANTLSILDIFRM